MTERLNSSSSDKFHIALEEFLKVPAPVPPPTPIVEDVRPFALDPRYYVRTFRAEGHVPWVGSEWVEIRPYTVAPSRPVPPKPVVLSNFTAIVSATM